MAFSIDKCTSPRWADQTHTQIRCDVTLAGLAETLPFMARADDREAHSQQLWQELIAGKYGEIAPYVPPQSPSPTASASAPKAI